MFKFRKSYLLVLVAMFVMAFASPAFAASNGTFDLTFDEDASTPDVTEKIGITPMGNIYFTVTSDLDDAAITFGRSFSVRWFADNDFEQSSSLISAERISNNVTVGPNASGNYQVRGRFAAGVVVVYFGGSGNGGGNNNGGGSYTPTNTANGTGAPAVEFNPLPQSIHVPANHDMIASVWCPDDNIEGELVVRLAGNAAGGSGVTYVLRAGCSGSGWLYDYGSGWTLEAINAEGSAHAARRSGQGTPTRWMNPAAEWGIIFAS